MDTALTGQSGLNAWRGVWAQEGSRILARPFAEVNSLDSARLLPLEPALAPRVIARRVGDHRGPQPCDAASQQALGAEDLTAQPLELGIGGGSL